MIPVDLSQFFQFFFFSDQEEVGHGFGLGWVLLAADGLGAFLRSSLFLMPVLRCTDLRFARDVFFDFQ